VQWADTGISARRPGISRGPSSVRRQVVADHSRRR
jgi:hypothetical protein